jgi:hypothetical protein
MAHHEEFWDFSPFILDVVNEVGGPIENIFSGSWEQKNWLNVPGPIYAGLTDWSLIGRLEAPDNVLYDENGQEFIFRQPRNRWELSQVVHAAAIDPFGGYACDGNEHWNTELIRDWWSHKADLVNWIGRQVQNPEFQTHQDFVEQNQLQALRHFEDFVQTGLHDYLRAYTFFLEQGHAPQGYEPLPWL